MADTSTITLIPPPLTPLIGRDAELATLLDLVGGESRLITITGIGGIGKTRLAHQAALELEPEFPGGAMIVPLAETRDAALVPTEIGRVFSRTDSIIDEAMLASMLGNEKRLLVLDNLEQIPEVGNVIVTLLQQMPALTVLGTSQIPLDVPGEQRFPLEPMTVETASAGSYRESPAIELFLHRAKAVDPRLEFDDSQLPLIAEICQILDGIPLAIELAAARLSIFSLPELRARLNDQLSVLSRDKSAPNERHRTMRNAIAWSYDLLDSDQKRLFRYLGVYAGGISLEAIEHTLRTLEITDDPIDITSLFVSRGLIRKEPTKGDRARYQMLRTLREFAIEQLGVEGDEVTARLAHATYIVDLAETAGPQLNTNNQQYWYQELDANRNNIEAAAQWALDHRPEFTVRIVAATWRELDYRGVSQAYIDLARLAIRTEMPDAVLGRGWLGIGLLEANLRADLDTAEESLKKALMYVRRSGDQRSEALALSGLGVVAMARPDFPAAIEFFQQGMELAESIGHTSGAYAARGNIAAIASFQNDLDRSVDLLLENIRAIEETGDLTLAGVNYCNIGLVQVRRGEYESARRHLAKAMDVARSLNNESMMLYALMNLGEANIRSQQYEMARENFEEGIRIAQRTHRSVHKTEFRTMYLATFALQGDWLEAVRRIPKTLTVSTSDAAAGAICHCAGYLMQALIAAGKREEAALLAGGALNTDLGSDPLPESVEAAGTAFARTIPEDPTHPERIAYETGKELPLPELSQRTANLAEHYLDAAGQEPQDDPPTRVDVSLTPRELEVLGMMAKGHTNAEIAEEMFISLRTITTHVSNIFNKLDVKNRSSAVAYALEHQLV